jgi:hypothetical protein
MITDASTCSGSVNARSPASVHPSYGGAVPDDALAVLVPGRDGPGDRFRALVGTPAGPDWVPATDLCGDGGLEPVLAGFRAAHGTGSDAVAGSLLVEAYAQRVVAPALAASVLAGRAVDTRPGAVTVRLAEGRVPEVAFRSWTRTADPPDAAVVAGLWPVVAAVHRRTRAGRRVLEGALAHAVAVACVHLSWPRPDHARHLTDARRVLAAAGLAGLVGLEAADVPGVGGGPWLYAERRSCCLAFRGSRHAGAYCATCPVVPADERRRSFTDAVHAYVRRTGLAT